MDSILLVMLTSGLNEADLRPALLLLANCHRHMAKKLRQTSENARATEESKHHDARSIVLFQKLFGTSSPPPIFDNSCVVQFPPPLVAGLRGQSTDNTLPQSSDQASDSFSTSKIWTADRPGTHDGTLLLSPQSGQKKMLEKEIQSLHDRLRNLEGILNQERVAKRSMEDRLAVERHRRQTIKEKLKKAERTIVETHRSEQYALEQYHAELEARRRAEDSIAELRERIALLGRELEVVQENDEKTKDFLRKMGLSLMKAANGNFTTG